MTGSRPSSEPRTGAIGPPPRGQGGPTGRSGVKLEADHHPRALMALPGSHDWVITRGFQARARIPRRCVAGGEGTSVALHGWAWCLVLRGATTTIHHRRPKYRAGLGLSTSLDRSHILHALSDLCDPATHFDDDSDSITWLRKMKIAQIRQYCYLARSTSSIVACTEWPDYSIFVSLRPHFCRETVSAFSETFWVSVTSRGTHAPPTRQYVYIVLQQKAHVSRVACFQSFPPNLGASSLLKKIH